ncbi:malate dehydrogenase-like [Leguminivora glycinivorella]|uniref:malate dehydrogenase-like n=1 Tax=Leguminivora glycinivorella TaxID=1035111 RepID=UPI00200F3369|nr:malate dehydrogenase-like [Leguminivora glycinivorella]
MFRLTIALVRRGHIRRMFLHTKPEIRPKDPERKGKFQVTIIGLNPVAQSLSLLLKNHPLVSRIVLYDRPKFTYGVGLDLSHIPSGPVAEGRAGHVGAALHNADVVCLACGELRKPGQTDYDLFKVNADLLIHPVQELCRLCPDAFVVDLTEPINYTVPLISRVMATEETYDPNKVLGVTGIDSMRAQARLHQLYEIPEPLKEIHVPVVCGHSASTSVPLVSHVRPWVNIDAKGAANIIEFVREASNGMLQSGSFQTSQLTAFAGVQMVSAILNALNGNPDAQIAFVANDAYKTKFFASPVKIQKDGISKIVDFKVISNIEHTYLCESLEELALDVDDAESYYKEICHKLT